MSLSIYIIATYGFITDFTVEDPNVKASLALKITSSALSAIITSGTVSYAFGKVGKVVDYFTGGVTVFNFCYKSMYHKDPMLSPVLETTPKGGRKDYQSIMKETEKKQKEGAIDVFVIEEDINMIDDILPCNITPPGRTPNGSPLTGSPIRSLDMPITPPSPRR